MNAATLPLTERIAETLRADDPAALRAQSPLVASLLDLLGLLGWGDCRRELVEALPHYENSIELPELRTMLLSFGLATDSRTCRVGDITPECLPCLFQLQGEALPWIVLGADSEGVRYRDPLSGEEALADPGSAGTAWLLTDIRHAASGPPENWFGDLLWRFRGLFKHLLAMTFFTNLVGLASPLFLMAIYDYVVGPGSTQPLLWLALGMALVLAIDFAMRVLKAHTMSLIAGRLEYLVSVEVFAKLVALPQVHTERATPDAQLAQIRQFEGIREFIAGPAASALIDAPFLLLYLGAMALVGGPLAWIPCGVAVLFALLGAVLVPLMQRHSAAAAGARMERQHHFMKTIAGLHEIKARCAEPAMLDRFRIASAASASATATLQNTQAVVDVTTQILGTVAAVLVVLFGVERVLAGELSTGGLVASIALTWRALAPLNALFGTLLQGRLVLRSITALNRLMRLRAERSEGATTTRTLSAAQGAISFERVVFRYTPASDPVMLGVSLDVKPGEFVAILGGNSSGKSTLFKLLLRMYEPQGGAVLVDGVDVRQMNVRELRRRVNYVPQHPKLFRGTLAQNLRLGNPLASDAALERALQRAGIAGAIAELPEGLATRVGDQHSARLPSSLIRSLCLARAFVGQSSIVLLDEPATALDSDNDKRLMEQIEALRGHATILMVSHRPSHIRLADRAVVLADGVVRFSGSPGEAISRMFGST